MSINNKLVYVKSEQELTETVSNMMSGLDTTQDANTVVAIAKSKLNEKITYVAYNRFEEMDAIAFLTKNPVPQIGEMKRNLGYVHNLSVPRFSEKGIVITRNDGNPYYSLF